jgi:predicted HicB family RNase H-like nuclease
MTTAVLDPINTMARIKRKTTMVRMDARIVEAARVIALARGVTIVDYLSDVLREQVERDRKEAIRLLSKPPKD